MGLRDLIGYKQGEEDPFLKCPCRRLVSCILVRALKDVFETAETPVHITRDAREWLYSRSKKPYSANWYAEHANLEWLLEKCRKIAKDRRFREQFLLYRDRPWS